jgi:dTDP-3-amino-3,4,6-trideoxy-alpha-D-glucose transaminase
MKVPFLDLARSVRSRRTELDAAVGRVLDRGWFVLGPELEALEQAFAAWAGLPFAIGVASGTDALTLALEASGAVVPGRGDEVVTTALSAAFTALAVHRAGAVPRFADVDPETLQLDTEAAAALVGPRTRALVPVHLYGNACPLGPLEALARRRRLALVEDACQAHGSRLGGRLLGTFGTAGCFSFYPTKNLGALGDGGMIVTADAALAGRARMLRHGGQRDPYRHELPGLNSRLDELQAAVLRLRLEGLEAANAARRELATRYDAGLDGLPLARVPVDAACEPNRHLYVVRLRPAGERDRLRAFLAERGVGTLVHYPASLPEQPVLAACALPGQRFPAAEAAAREIVSLPLYPELEAAEVDYVVGQIRAFFGRRP